MKRFLQFFAAVTTAALSTVLFAQSVPDINFDASVDFISLPAYGEVAGVATNSRGQIYVLARTGHAVATIGDERTFYHGGSRLFQFDQSGRFVKEIGQGTYGMTFAQQVRLDPQDNVWTVDAGSNILTKFDSEGRFLTVIGRKPETIGVRKATGVPARAIDAAGGPQLPTGGDVAVSVPGAGTKSELFSLPSDVAFDRAGNVYVADGFGTNNRIAVFNREGNWVTGWGQTGSGQGQFNKIRGIASDAAGNIYVADSGNSRIQTFDGKGAFKSQITGIGSPKAICVSGGATQYLFSSNSNDPESMNGGEIYKVSLTGQVLGKFGKAGKLLKEFGMTNAIDCRTENELLIGEVWNWRVQKVTLRR